MLTTSVEAGTLAGLQVEEDDHEPEAALLIVDVAAKSGM
jgi:hypothetical protein